jgi:hypothetical protein
MDATDRRNSCPNEMLIQQKKFVKVSPVAGCLFVFAVVDSCDVL